MLTLALSKLFILNTVSEAIYPNKSQGWINKRSLYFKNRKLTFPAQVKEISFNAVFLWRNPRLELGLSWGFAPFVKTKEQAFLPVSKWKKKSIFVSLTQEAQITDLRFHPSRWNQLRNPLHGRRITEGLVWCLCAGSLLLLVGLLIPLAISLPWSDLDKQATQL